MARELIVWQFVDNTTQSNQYILTEPHGDHVENPIPLYTEGTYPDQPPFGYRHTVVEPAPDTKTPGVSMTMYSVSNRNPWEGTGECTTTPLYT